MSSKLIIGPPARALLSMAIALLTVLGLAGEVAADPARDAFNRQDFATALRLWKAEAESGNPTSPMRVGDMYMGGHGVRRDPVEAVRWYRMAADRREWSGQMRMAEAYRSGVGVKQDYVEAARWYMLAGERSYGTAHLFLAEIYAKGEGVPQNFVEAYKWYTLYASMEPVRNGTADWNKGVLATRDTMAAEKMTPDQIGEAEKLAREWKPKR